MKKEIEQTKPSNQELVDLIRKQGYDDYEIQLILSNTPEEILERYEQKTKGNI